MHANKNLILRIFNYVLLTVAYSFLVYKFATFEDYPALMEHFRHAGIWQAGALILAILLFPLNFFFESWKWQFLLRDVVPMSLVEAQKQVYYGTIGAFVTPLRSGDYPTRVTRIADTKKWVSCIALGGISSTTMNIGMMFLGLIGFVISMQHHPEITGSHLTEQQIYTMSAIVFSIFIGIILAAYVLARIYRHHPIKHESMRQTVEALADLSATTFAGILAIGALRYMVYCTQMMLALYFCGVELSLVDYMTAVPTFYLFVTLTPSMPAADAAVRGSLGFLVFSAYTPNTAGVAIATILMWCLNALLPMVVGSFVKKTDNQLT